MGKSAKNRVDKNEMKESDWLILVIYKIKWLGDDICILIEKEGIGSNVLYTPEYNSGIFKTSFSIL